MELHVVFGSGQVGAPLVQELVARGHRVRVVRRTQGAASAGVELAVGNAFDRTVCVQNAQSATAVYHCLNVAYSTKAWADELPKFQENLIEAAGRTGARLVVLENLYMLGRPNGPLNEHTPAQPASRKGELRRKLSEALFAAHRAGTVKVVAGRASDLFGPGVSQSQIGENLFARVLAGKSAQVFGDPDALHSFSYAPDVARGLAALAGAPRDELPVGGRFRGRRRPLPRAVQIWTYTARRCASGDCRVGGSNLRRGAESSESFVPCVTTPSKSSGHKGPKTRPHASIRRRSPSISTSRIMRLTWTSRPKGSFFASP